MSADDPRPSPLSMPPRRASSGIVLPDDAPVLRGGRCNLDDLVMSALFCEEQNGRPGLSVVAADVPTHLDLLRQSSLLHNDVSRSTMGRLREAGLRDIQQTGKPPHHTVWFSRRSSEDDLDELSEELARFADAFDPYIARTKL
jgi:hypothetical protein